MMHVSVFSRSQPFRTELRHWNTPKSQVIPGFHLGGDYYCLEIKGADGVLVDIFADTIDELRAIFAPALTQEMERST